MDRQRMEHCLVQVVAYRASGQSSERWALANGIKPRELASWCAHAKRWRALLDGVAASLPTRASASTVRVELQAGPSRVELHWPLSHTVELAALLREVGR